MIFDGQAVFRRHFLQHMGAGRFAEDADGNYDAAHAVLMPNFKGFSQTPSPTDDILRRAGFYRPVDNADDADACI